MPSLPHCHPRRRTETMLAWDYAALSAGGLGALIVLSFIVSKLRATGFDVDGKHVFITGGSSGLGLATAKLYAAAGAKVSIVARRLDLLEDARAEIEAVRKHIENRVFVQSCDVADFSAVQRAINAANAFHGGATDHLVCCAGYVQPGYFLEQDVSIFKRMVDVNYLGSVHVVKAALPAMVASPAPNRRIVFVASAFSLISCIGVAQYAASKYALRGLAEALRNELKMFDIGISVFYAGNIDTPCFEEEQRLMPHEGKTIEGVSAPLSPDKAAQQMINGVAGGEFSITNDPLVFLLRILSNGVTPRWNSPLELVLLPLIVPIQMAFLVFMDSVVLWSRRQRQAKDKTA